MPNFLALYNQGDGMAILPDSTYRRYSQHMYMLIRNMAGFLWVVNLLSRAHKMYILKFAFVAKREESFW